MVIILLPSGGQYISMVYWWSFWGDYTINFVPWETNILFSQEKKSSYKCNNDIMYFCIILKNNIVNWSRTWQYFITNILLKETKDYNLWWEYKDNNKKKSCGFLNIETWTTKKPKNGWSDKTMKKHIEIGTFTYNHFMCVLFFMLKSQLLYWICLNQFVCVCVCIK